MIIGCDIGGVIKEMISDNTIENSIETLQKLEEFGHTIIFISKCKDGYKQMIIEWLKNNKLYNKVFFCSEYSQKNIICKENKVEFMIDDKLTVLNDIDININKIWFCSDSKKIIGAKKYQNDQVSKVTICDSWNDIYNMLCDIQ